MNRGYSLLSRRCWGGKLNGSICRQANCLMSEFVTVARVGAIAEGQGGTFQVGERLVPNFRPVDYLHRQESSCSMTVAGYWSRSRE